MTAHTSASPRHQRAAGIDRRTWRLCWVIVLGAFASGLDASVVTIGLTRISTDLHSPLATTQWVANGYLLAMALSLPLAGWLGRRYGTGRVWLAALAAFTLMSGLCALAPTIGLLIAARVVQGLAGGVLIPAGQTILGQAVGPDRLGRVMGTLGIAVSAAPALGPLVGALILHHLPWPSLFVINLPLGAAGLLLGRALVPRGHGQRSRPPRLPDIALITVGLPAIVLALTLWGNAGRLTTAVTLTAAVGIGSLMAFTLTTRHADRPLLDLTLYRNPGFRAGTIAALCSGVMVFGSGIVLTLYFQIGRNLSTLQTGLALLGPALATAVAAPLTGKWIDRAGPGRVALCGGLLALATTVPLTLMPLNTPLTAIQTLLIGFGAAVSLTAMPAGIAAYRAVHSSQLPDAITQTNIAQRLGGSLGGAICAVLIAAHQTSPHTAFHLAYGALALNAVAATVAAWLVHLTERPASAVHTSAPATAGGRS